MNRKINILPFALEYLKNKNYTKNLFWYKKNTGKQWFHGQNFGDYLSTIIVSEIAKSLGFKRCTLEGQRKLLAVGSILHFAKNNDVIWGSGINGKIDRARYTFKSLDVRMVRGPLTREFLGHIGIKGIKKIYGDPALLLPFFLKKYKYTPVKNKIIYIPNLNQNLDKVKISRDIKCINPMRHWHDVLIEILSSELVLASSLHGLILSEAFNVPVRLLPPPPKETLFKYRDYLLGTGRKADKLSWISDQIVCVKESIKFEPPMFNINNILSSFPKEIFI